MENALGEPQTIVLLGGTSDIGLAIVERLLVADDAAPSCSPGGGPARCAADELERPGVEVDAVALRRRRRRRRTRRSCATSSPRTATSTWSCWRSAQLGDQAELDADPVRGRRAGHGQLHAARSASASPSPPSSARQGHGRLVVLSSVAGERVRKANFVYGSSKAGLDGFAQGLGDALAGTGASVLVVRPGFVHSAMTAGLKPAPFATTPAAVADATVAALAKGRRTVWVPGILRFVFSAFRHLPGPIWRRLPLG